MLWVVEGMEVTLILTGFDGVSADKTVTRKSGADVLLRLGWYCLYSAASRWWAGNSNWRGFESSRQPKCATKVECTASVRWLVYWVLLL